MIQTMEEIGLLLQTIQRGKRNLRIYPENNPIYARTVNEIFSQITSVLENSGTVTLKIRQYEIISDNEVVYESRDRHENLALMFFRDGIRELTFIEGLPEEELEAFLQVISTDFEKDYDDDIVTLLWEKDFKYIQHVVDDTFLFEDESYEEFVTEQVKGNFSDEDSIIEAYEHAIETEERDTVEIMPFSNEDLENVVEEIEIERNDKTEDLLHMLFEMIFIADDESEYDEINEFIKKVLKSELEKGNLHVVNDSLRKVRDFLQSNSVGHEKHRYFESLENYVASEDLIRVFGNALENEVEMPEEQIVEFARLLPGQSIPAFLEVMGELNNISSRKTMIGMLAETGKKNVSLLEAGLKDERWYVVRNVVYVLRMIGGAAAEKLLLAVGHNDKRVRKEALRALGDIKSVEAMPVIERCLLDDDESVRLAAVRAMGKIASPGAYRILLDRIKEKNFLRRRFSEKKEFFEILSRWTEKEVIEELKKILEKKHLFKHSAHCEVKAAAVYCMGLIGTHEMMKVLKAYTRSKNRLLRENAEEAIKRIRNGKIK